MTQFMGWGLYLTGQDPEDLSSYEYIGARKTPAHRVRVAVPPRLSTARARLGN